MKTREPFEYYPGWRADAECATPENRQKYFEEKDIWFVEPAEEGDTKAAEEAVALTAMALSICATCPVRDLCLREQLETSSLDGTRGGLTEEQTRRTLSVDEFGKEIRRGEFPDCPYCGANTARLELTTIELPDGGRWSVAKAVRCQDCGFEWKSRSSHNAVSAFFTEQKKKADAARREQIARDRLSNS